MTAFDRVAEMLAGTSVDPKVAMVWSASPGHQADIVTSILVELPHALKTHPEQLVLLEVLSPFGVAQRRDIDLNSILAEDPELGQEKLEAIKEEVAGNILKGLDAGAHGVLYRLDGAYPRANTPMQYGGYYLELDRELLALAEGCTFNCVNVEGEGEIYFDFVSDLPTHAFSWSTVHNHISLDGARKMTPTRLALGLEDADIHLARNFDEIERLRERLATK